MYSYRRSKAQCIYKTYVLEGSCDPLNLRHKELCSLRSLPLVSQPFLESSKNNKQIRTGVGKCISDRFRSHQLKIVFFSFLSSKDQLTLGVFLKKISLMFFIFFFDQRLRRQLQRLRQRGVVAAVIRPGH